MDATPARLTVDARRAIFLAVVEAQDAGATVPAARAAVAEKFGVDPAAVAAVEREGVAEGWPPLD